MEKEQKITNAIPNVLLNGRPYIIDVEERVIKSYDENRTISFDALKNEDDYSTLVMSRRGNFHLTASDYNEHVVIKIPSELLRVPAIGRELRDEYNIASIEHNWGIYIVDETLGKRLAGGLPHLNILGTDFTVDWRLKELRETAVPSNILKFDQMYLSENGESYLCYYNKNSHALYLPQPGITEIPQHVAMLSIPNELHLDPVGVSRQFGLKDYELLREFPIRSNIKADELPISESPLQEIVKQNINKRESERQLQHKGLKRSRRL